jgi:signal transduction histidine kinase
MRVEGAPRILRSLDEVALGVIDSIRVVTPTVIEYLPSGQDISVDGAAVERALANVVDNACRAAGSDGRVRIDIESGPGGRAIITVDDSGPGFAAGISEHTGVGLDSSRRALGPLGGTLRISTRGPMGGARVELYVPSHSYQPSSEGAQ